MNKPMRIYLLVGILSASFFMSCSGEGKGKKEKDQKSVPVQTVSTCDTIISNKFVADIQARNNVEIHARVSGLLDKVFVREGQKVSKGQPLFKINDAELQISLLKAQALCSSAKAALRIATVELDQAQTLFNKRVIADNELELAKAKRDAAEAQLAHADAERKAISQKISFTTITAPFEGIIDRLPLREGSLVADGELLTTISQLDDVYAYFSIPEGIYFQMMSERSLEKQRDIQLILPNGVVYDHKGELRTADGEIDRQTGAIQYKAKFNNPNGFIKHGTSGKLVISEPREGVILIPHKAVFSIQDKHYVFVVNADNTVKMTNIELGGTLDDVYIVDRGLKNNDRIVNEGTQSLRDGDRISIKNSKNNAS